MIDKQSGYGGTELNDALETALALSPKENTARSIVLTTDGYVSGETETFDLICENLDNAAFSRSVSVPVSTAISSKELPRPVRVKPLS